MPYYVFELTIPLTPPQQDAIAAEVTRLHSTLFSTPKLFVNVAFHDMRSVGLYVAGKRRQCNKLIANVRNGPSRSQEDWDELCKGIYEVWNREVGGKGDEELRAVFVMGGMIAGSECGFSIPKAGEEKAWFKKNAAAFQKKADEGDEEFAEMLEEVRTRSDLSGMANGH